MMFWIILAAYQAVWFIAVIGAGRGSTLPGLLAAAVFIAWRLGVSTRRGIDLRLIGIALLLGSALDFVWVQSGLIRYASPWPLAVIPAWLMAVWVAFALTILPLFGYLHGRPWTAASFGAIGGPLSFLAAARLHAVVLAPPTWRTLLALGIGWAIALPTLTALARRWSHVRDIPRGTVLPHGSSP